MSAGVWLLTTYPLWFDNGYATNVRATAMALRREGGLAGLVSIVPSRLFGSPSCKNWAASFQHETGLTVALVPSSPDLGVASFRAASDLVTVLRLKTALRSAGAALVHARGTRASYLMSRIATVPYLMDIRGDAVAEAMLDASICPSPRASRFIQWAQREERMALEGAAGFAVVSDAMRAWLEESIDARERPVCVLPCPVNVERFAARSAFKPLTEIVVAYVGGLQSYQPAELVASSIRDIARVSPLPIHAWVVTPERHEAVRALLDSYGVRHTVEALDHGSIESRLCVADVGIVPRRIDPVSSVSCPTKIGEYLAAGVPVLAGEGVGMWARRLAADDVGGLLDSEGQVDSHVASMLARIAESRAEYAAHCVTVARRDWSWESAAPRMHNLYATLTESQHSGPHK